MWNRWIAYTVSVVCGLIALMLIFYKQVSINTTGGVVMETTLLFGLLRVRQRRRQFSEFKAICYYVSDQGEGGCQTWAVALDPQAGYPLDLRYFFSRTAHLEALEFANELGRATGLEVKQQMVKNLFGFHRMKRAKQ
jgi:energy-converting hydrogenase Eha subunit G